MNDAQLKDIALNFQAGINNELLKENEELKRKIAALQTEPCEDAISRRAAIDTFHDWLCSYHIPCEFIDAIKNMPSVQPTQKEDIGVCKYAPYGYDIDKCPFQKKGCKFQCIKTQKIVIGEEDAE